MNVLNKQQAVMFQ